MDSGNHHSSHGDDAALNAAVSALLGEPLDEAAIERVEQRALSIASDASMESMESMESKPTARGAEAERGEIKRRTADRRRWLRAGSLAVSLAATLLLAVYLLSDSSSVAFSQVVERVARIRNVQFVVTLQPHLPTPIKGMIRGDVLRLEQGPPPHPLVTLQKTSTHETLILDPARKLAQRPRVRERLGNVAVNPLAELAGARDKSVRSLGQDRVDGQVVDVYRVKGLSIFGVSPDAELTLWADATTQLPVRIRFEDLDPKHKLSLTFSDFQWNAELADEWFAMEIPEGFALGEIVRDPFEKRAEPPQYAQELAAGVLFSGRVASRVEIDRERGTVTALLRDPESQQGTGFFPPHEIRQWEIATGKLRWQESVGGAGDFAVCQVKDLLAVVQGQEVQIRRLSTGKLLRTWECDEPLGTLAISRDGALLARGHIRWSTPPVGSVEIWDLASGRRLHHLEDLDRVDALEFSPTEDLLLVCSAAGKAKLFHAKSGSLEYSFMGGTHATFSPDGKLLAAVSPESSADKSRGRVDLIDVGSRQVTRTFASPAGKSSSWLLSLAFSPQGKRLAAADWNGSVTIWDLGSASAGQFESVGPLPHGVHRVRFIDESRLVTGCEDGLLRLHRTGE
ncbi:MAG: hypothetical protein KDB14_14220 [Planctomycetales bacterium]|nr:hypothetical protein [Planctomycetales bacterium]